MDNQTEYLTAQEAADLLRLTRRTVYNWLASGRLQGYNVGGDHWLIHAQSIIELLEKGDSRAAPVIAPKPSPLSNRKSKHKK